MSATVHQTKDPQAQMQAATNVPPPPPIEDSDKVVKIPTELEKIENTPSPEEIRKEFEYAKGKINFSPSAWNEITDITSSADGAGGVFFVNVPKSGGTVVVKGSPDIVKEVFASKLAAMVGVIAPEARVLDYKNPSNEWKIMKTQIKEFATKENRDADLTKAQKVLKRAFLIVMEVFLGTDLEKVRRQTAEDLFIIDDSKSEQQRKNTLRLLRQLGRLVAFDMLCNNWDRLPVIWDNEGNLRNIRVEHIGVGEPNIIALDNTITCIIPENFNTYEEKLRDCLTALTTDVNTEYKGYKTVREVLSFTSSVDFTEKETREMQIGTLEGILAIAKLTPESLTKLKEEFSQMVVQDWENVWSSGVESINIDFLTSVINIMKEYVPSAQKALDRNVTTLLLL